MNLRTANKHAKLARRRVISTHSWATWARMAEKANRTGNYKALKRSGYVRRRARSPGWSYDD